MQKDNFQQTCSDWCVAYHGGMSGINHSILLRGLRRPGEEGVVVAHGQVHSKTNKFMYLLLYLYVNFGSGLWGAGGSLDFLGAWLPGWLSKLGPRALARKRQNKHSL